MSRNKHEVSFNLWKERARGNNYTEKSTLPKDKQVDMVGGVEERPRRWAEYFTEVFEGEQYEEEGEKEEDNIEIESIPRNDTQEMKEPPKAEDIDRIIRLFKNNMGPGKNTTIGKMLKLYSDEGRNMIHRIMDKIWEEEKMPNKWRLALESNLHKNY